MIRDVQTAGSIAITRQKPTENGSYTITAVLYFQCNINVEDERVLDIVI